MEISLEPEQEELISALVTAHHKLPRNERQDFKYTPAHTRSGTRPRKLWEETIKSGGSISFKGGIITNMEDIPWNLDHDIIFHPGFDSGKFDTVQADIDALELYNLIKFRDKEKFFISPKGFDFYKQIKESSNETGSIPKLGQEKMANQADPKKVFVVHGRNSKARKALFQFLRSIGLQPLEWSQAVELTKKAAPYVGEVLDTAFSSAQAVIVLFTPDDVAMLAEEYRNDDDEKYEIELTPQARPNVIFEAGMAMGRDADRTVLIELGKLRPFSDIGGRHVIRLNNSVASRQSLAQRLETAGCAINLKGTDWHEDGDFESVISEIKKKS